MEHVAPILQAVAALAWAGFAFTALYVLKPHITGMLARLRKGKIFGQSFELSDELAKLEISAAAVTKEAQSLPLPEYRTEGTDRADELDVIIKSILEQASKSPKIALMTLWAELEKQARHALASRGILRGRPAVSLSQALTELHQYGFPANMSGSLKLFDEARNKIIHGAAATDDDALRALDSGLTILRALNALPLEVNIVHHPGVEVFSNPACTQRIVGTKGVILETTSPGGVIKTFRIFPTTRSHFQRGKQVAWEWNTQRLWAAAWYRDSDTGAIKEAWVSAAEFIGRHLDDV
jgi:hypothetical protein